MNARKTWMAHMLIECYTCKCIVASIDPCVCTVIDERRSPLLIHWPLLCLIFWGQLCCMSLKLSFSLTNWAFSSMWPWASYLNIIDRKCHVQCCTALIYSHHTQTHKYTLCHTRRGLGASETNSQITPFSAGAALCLGSGLGVASDIWTTFSSP